MPWWLAKTTFCLIGRTKNLQARPTHKLLTCLISVCHLTQVSWISWEATGVMFDSKYRYFVSYITGALFLWFSKAIRLEVIRTTICYYSLTLWCCQTEWWLLLIIFRNGSYLKEYPRHSSMLRLSPAPLKSQFHTGPLVKLLLILGSKVGAWDPSSIAKSNTVMGPTVLSFLRSRWPSFANCAFGTIIWSHRWNVQSERSHQPITHRFNT